ncbi:hypothetical protein M408DRAFT_114703 [Serendipita vermifera MAFF 305830]|uniref:Uncharacterized protein n=1 Tax=Serendipita vermifera MAFF 305830 TaxID=933852 RepID=A0A0C2WTM1_SERVB|nr:hypothetical protein M408DRAFT_114703 [Serendipita vermifera MAFF 305830]
MNQDKEPGSGDLTLLDHSAYVPSQNSRLLSHYKGPRILETLSYSDLTFFSLLCPDFVLASDFSQENCLHGLSIIRYSCNLSRIMILYDHLSVSLFLRN